MGSSPSAHRDDKLAEEVASPESTAAKRASMHYEEDFEELDPVVPQFFAQDAGVVCRSCSHLIRPPAQAVLWSRRQEQRQCSHQRPSLWQLAPLQLLLPR